MSDRLSQISTAWSLFRRAHQREVDAHDSRRQLFERYCGAAYRYLLGAVKNEEAAADLFQEFAVRWMQGDFFRASPDRGRLRDYLKASLRNLVNDHWNNLRNHPQRLPPDIAAHSEAVDASGMDDREFEFSLRQELLQQAWTRLEQQNPRYYAALTARSESPDVPAQELTERLNIASGNGWNARQLRVTLHRARKKLAELLLDEVALTIPHPTVELLRAELAALGLSEICREALAQRKWN